MNNPENIMVGWIAGMPRSGTTWLSQIFASSPDVRLKFCPLFSYEFKNILDESSSASEWDRLFKEVYHTSSDYLDQNYLRDKGLVPTFTYKEDHPQHLIIKSTRFHNLVPLILELNDKIRFVHLVRNPCATIYSWLSNPYEFPQDLDKSTEWKTGNCRKKGPGEFWGFNDWKLVTQQALDLSKKYPERFKLTTYENLAVDTKECVKELFKFFKISYESQTDEFIDLSHSKHDDNKRSVFKKSGVNREWEKSLDANIRDSIINDLKNTELEKFL